MVGDGRAVVHAAQLGSSAAGIQHGGNQGGLARVRVPDHDQIADVVAFVNLQSASFNKRGPARLAGDSNRKCSTWTASCWSRGSGAPAGQDKYLLNRYYPAGRGFWEGAAGIAKTASIAKNRRNCRHRRN